MAQQVSQKIAQQIVESVKDVCGQDVNFIDTEGKIFASTNKKRIGDYHEIGHQVYLTKEAIEVDADNSFYGTNKGVNIPFQYNGKTICVVGISGVPDEVRKYAYLAQKITSLILREHELDTQSNNKKAQINYIIHSLITNQHMNEQFLSDSLTALHIDSGEMYCTLVIHLNSRYNPSNLSMVEQRIYQVFDTIGSKLYTFNYPNEYIILLTNQMLDHWKYLFDKLASEYADFIKIGIGSSMPLLRQNQSYDAAQISLHSMKAGSTNIACFDELDLEILLGSITEDARTYYLKKTIDALSSSEIDLLYLYFTHDMSLKKTSDAAFLHKNTLQYRLDKIWRTTGYNPRSFQDAAVLYMALKLS